MFVKLLNEHNLEFLSLTRSFTGSSESTVVKMPHCWKSRVTTQMIYLPQYNQSTESTDGNDVL